MPQDISIDTYIAWKRLTDEKYKRTDTLSLWHQQ